MDLHQNKSWFLGIFAFVALFAGSSMLLTDTQGDQSTMIQFSDLSDSDIDNIIAVKAEMHAAKVQSN